ncbi:MAG: hypothetical protein GX125_01660 [Bacteroidales bacterium]|jgi:Na+-transporting methylmalonyl-CoA/oxaloacetate decarboxylase gamma subunit|nr:OadG family transporter subunit [Bacteroidota bacterium]NLN98965.1 hypothetical protein [Bacteroidales bacterium]
MIFKKIVFPSLLLLFGWSLPAQNLIDLRISEILVENTSGLIDDFGRRNGWIEIFNTSYGTVQFGGCYLSDDPSDLKKFHIPTADNSTSIGPRQSVVFYASGNASQGTYYTNFTLRRGAVLYLVSNDGKTILDTMEIPADLQADRSVMRIPIGIKKMEFETKNNADPTPASYNGDLHLMTKSETMKVRDPGGWILTMISVITVFISLVILAFIFGWMGNVGKKTSGIPSARKASAAGAPSPEVVAVIAMAIRQELGGEVNAAIALALHDYLEGRVHDSESFVITIKPSGQSGWNNKSLTFRKSVR